MRDFNFSDETYDQLLTLKKFLESLATKPMDTPSSVGIMEMIVDHYYKHHQNHMRAFLNRADTIFRFPAEAVAEDDE